MSSSSLRPLTFRHSAARAGGLPEGSLSSTVEAGMGDAIEGATISGVNIDIPPLEVTEHHLPHGWLPSRSTFVFCLVALHLAVLCYWGYLMYQSHRRAKAAAALRGEPRTPPPKVNCTYEWSSLGDDDPGSKGFFSRFRFKPAALLEKKHSGRPLLRSELATVGITTAGLPSRPRLTRSPTLPSTPELV